VPCIAQSVWDRIYPSRPPGFTFSLRTFSLRTLFVVVSLGTFLGWTVPPAWTMHKRKAFVRKVIAAGGRAIPLTSATRHEDAAWGNRAYIRRLLGDELIATLEFDGSLFDDTDTLFPEVLFVKVTNTQSNSSGVQRTVSTRYYASQRGPTP
jgi:hypothetical protein